MKSKPLKHKATNRFKFIPFSERINTIDIRHAALYHIEHANSEQPEENETHFAIALRKWHVLNLTDNFRHFRKDVAGIITLAQLVHRKEYVLDTLEKYLKLGDTLCIQALLEILVSVAKDLREDFYPHFGRFLDILIGLLQTKDADQLEWTLICLAFLFKVLRTHLRKDISVVLKRIIPLLSDSQPQYINNFAAESFAFVARDVKDKNKFLLLMLSYLKTHDDAIRGCGHLIFEIMKGVSGKFHSCAETFLPCLLELLKSHPEHQELLFQVLTQTVSDMLQHVDNKESYVFWKSVAMIAESALADLKENDHLLEFILKLAGQALEYYKGKFLSNPVNFVQLLIKILNYDLSETVAQVCARIGALLLLSPHVSLSQEHASIIVMMILPMPYPQVLLEFVENVVDYSQFDMLVLPQFLAFLGSTDYEERGMKTLTKVCLRKSPTSRNGIKLFEWTKYPLDLGKNASKLNEKINHELSSEDVEKILQYPENILRTLIYIPHLKNLNVDKNIELVNKFIANLLNMLSQFAFESSSENENKNIHKSARKIIFILGHAIECAVHISSCKNVGNICPIDKLLSVLLPYASHPQFVCALQVIDLYITAYEQEGGLTYPFLTLVDSYLSKNINSPYHEVRLLTTHIYKLFEKVQELNITQKVGDNIESFQVFSLCYSVESIRPTVQEYRTQINYLQKVSFDSIQNVIAKNTDFKHYALKYMLGILYMNFKLLWEPVIEFIAGYATGLKAEEFWPVFYASVENAFENMWKNEEGLNFSDEFATADDIFKELYEYYNNVPERTDFGNYRNLMLQTMGSFIEVCENKNRDVATLVLKFIEKEYRNNENSRKANALKTDVELHEINNTLEEEQPEEDLDISTIPIEEDDISISGKITFKTLLNIMQVLSKFKNPRALYKESEFWELYMEFLSHKNSYLQKCALECILNYKNKNVTPYKENLHNLVDDKKFKDELASFKITKDSDSIRCEDRAAVMPIILRILYGKMVAKLGAEKKGGGQAKRSLIMRNLAGCTEEEVTQFIEMAFTYFKNYINMTPKEIYSNVITNLNLKAIISPSKLHSTLNLLEVIREYFGGYLGESSLPTMFKVFYAIISVINAVLSRSNEIHPGYVKVMKNLRVISLSLTRKLFDQFDRYLWSEDELFVIFESIVFPLLPKLPIEGIHSPTALLKLFMCWSKNPRYFILLVTNKPDETALTPIPYIFNLLLSNQIKVGVINVIMDMIENLLTLQDEQQEETVEGIAICPLKSFSVVQTTQSAEQLRDLNFGSKILLPHICSILEIMKKRVANVNKTKTLNKRDLLILSRVTELVTDPEISEELLDLLLPILVKKVCANMAEENMEHAITTVVNLLEKSVNPRVYIKHLAILFNKVIPVGIRKLLCKMLTLIAHKSKDIESVTLTAKVLLELNAYNSKWIEQPDFDRRLDAYKLIYDLADDDKIDIELAILVVNNCFYSIKSDKDISLRDSAGLCLKKILPKLMLKYKSAKDGAFFVRETVLAHISTGIRDLKNETLHNAAIELLGVLVRECPTADVVLSDLTQLACEDDREVDFFDNLVHLQMHRRVRALLKFSKVVKKMTKCPTPRTLTNFILPLATMHLCDDKYIEKNTLIDACIEVVGTCTRLLPWYHYEVILKYYLNKMRHSTEHQKQLTRILIAVLDSFHFDLSKAGDIVIPKALLANMDENSKITIVSAINDVEEDNTESKEEIVDNNDDESDKFQEELNTADQSEDPVDEQAHKDTNSVVTQPAFERIFVISPSVAKRVVKSLTSILLPQLNRSISKMTDHEESHKLNRKSRSVERQEQDVLKVPIALAIVKLLQRLPGDILKVNLPGIIIKLCSFLKSPLKQVRIAARDIVKKIMLTVGTPFLGVLLEHLTLLLTRGFQVHVLVATIHTVLDAVKDKFTEKEIDTNLKYILDVCVNDLFGSLSEEKEVDKLGNKTPEAKPSKKSLVTLAIVAQNVHQESLISLVLPFKEILQKYHSKKVVVKVQETFAHITTGLAINKFVSPESLFMFLYNVAHESIPELVISAPKRELTEEQREKILRTKPDCFLLPEQPKRNREAIVKRVRTSATANAHVLVEFSLNMFYVLLKREKLSKLDHSTFIDPMIPLLADSLQSDHVRVTTVALKCLSTLWTMKLSTPQLQKTVKDVTSSIFSILHKYATFGINKQDDNFLLVKNAFKAVTTLIRNVKYHQLDTDQLKTLLLYAEEDCEKDDKQAHSFSLLKAILEAQLVSPELHEVMVKIANISILSESQRSRDESRQIFATYLTSYSLGKKIERHMQFFVAQLNYEMQHGRQSALNFLITIIGKWPQSYLSKHAGYLAVSLGAAMLNDPAAECRSLAARAVEALLARLGGQDRATLFQLVVTFFNDDKPVHHELAAQLCARFVVVEQQAFKSRLQTTLPLISAKLSQLNDNDSQGRFVRLNVVEQSDATDEEKQKERDHSLIQILNLMDKIIQHCPVCLTDSKYNGDIDDISQRCQVLLAHSHLWVRLKAVKILTDVLETVNPEELSKIIRGEVESERGFLYYDTENSLRSLVLDLCAQYVVGVTKEMAEQVTSAMLRLFRVVNSIPELRSRGAGEQAGEGGRAVDAGGAGEQAGEGGRAVDAKWLVYQLRRAINVEVARAPLDTCIRISIFSTLTHIVNELPADDLPSVVPPLLVSVARELGSAEPARSGVRQLAGRVGKKLRRRLGDVAYGRLLAAAQNKLNARRAERKKQIVQEKVINPERAAKRKLQLKEKKKDSKKKKIEMLQEKRPRPKKRKAEDIDIEDEF